MDGKRSSKDNPNKKESKRAKIDFPIEVELDGIEYINLTRLLKTAPFASYHAKHYKASEKRFIETEAIEVFNVSKQNVSDGVFAEKSVFSPAHDLRLVRKDKIGDFIKRVQRKSPPTAPAILDEPLTFTYDPGKTNEANAPSVSAYEVEMRGKRTEEGIYLKVKDIGRVCGLLNLANDIQHKHTQLEEGKDYVWFTIPDHERKKNAPSREVFFTYTGMLAAVFISKSEVAKHFRKWVSETVFVHHLGTAVQKSELARSLLDKKMIGELSKRCGYDISCVYLLESTRDPGDGKRVYKFGYTKSLQQRMVKLVREHGRDSVIDTILLLPAARLSAAETEIKHVLGDTYRFEEGKLTELVSLSEEECTALRLTMRSIGKMFYGEALVHAHQMDMLKKDAQLTLERVQSESQLALERVQSEAQLALERAQSETKLAKKDLELAKKDIEILTLRIKELESKLSIP